MMFLDQDPREPHEYKPFPSNRARCWICQGRVGDPIHDEPPSTEPEPEPDATCTFCGKTDKPDVAEYTMHRAHTVGRDTFSCKEAHDCRWRMQAQLKTLRAALADVMQQVDDQQEMPDDSHRVKYQHLLPSPDPESD